MTQARMLGCNEAQGYYIGRPQPLDRVVGLIDDYRPRQAQQA